MPGNCLLFRGLWTAGPYSVYVLIILLFAYLFNQLDRFMLAITNPSMSRDVGYGDLACLDNLSLPDTAFLHVNCLNTTNEQNCDLVRNQNGSKVCEWDHSGKGSQYDLLAGPIFILVYTFVGIFLAFAADVYNRKILLGICVILWSAVTILTGFVKEYWQLVLLRFCLGIAEAGCTPFAASLIGDYFFEENRATAMGIYNFGIYVGYSMSYAIGNFITQANILGQGWRWAYYLSGIPGVIVGIVILVTVREPNRSIKIDKSKYQNKNRDSSEEENNEEEEEKLLPKEENSVSEPYTQLKTLISFCLTRSLIILYLAGSVRNAAGYVFAYYGQTYYETLGESKESIGTYFSWIPIVGGCLSVLFGGFIADKVVKSYGLTARLSVIVISLLLASPFAAGALFLTPPLAYLSLLPSYLIGEMWISITLTMVVELVPRDMRASAVAIYLFVITNIGGNASLLVTPLQSAFQSAGYNNLQSLRAALYILYPGTYIIGAVLYMLAFLLLRRDARRVAEAERQLSEDHHNRT